MLETPTNSNTRIEIAHFKLIAKKILETGKTKVTETTKLFRQFKLFSNKFKDYGMTRTSPTGNQSLELCHAIVALCSTWNCIALLKQKVHLGLEKKSPSRELPR
jgi:hypothetical protein